jgi:predicted nucleotidyltransferase
MAVDIETVNTTAASYVKDVKRVMPVYKAVLYGSYAKGTATEYSDVDICFFLHSFNGKTKVVIVAELLDLAAKYYKTVYIEPRAFIVTDMQNDTPFIREVLRTGYEV